MSLSRFYKSNTEFQAQSVLNKSCDIRDEPVWGSIVKDEGIVPEENVTEVILESPETNLAAEVVAEPVPSPPPDSPPTPVQPEVTIDIEAIKQNAFSSGVEAGRKQAEKDFENSAQTFMCICRELDSLRETILKNSTAEMKELVLAISEKIIRHSVTEQNETIVATIKDAIRLAVKSDEFQIQINPADLAAVKTKKQEIIETVSGLNNIALMADPNIERGGCKLESTCCTIDATMIGQIQVIHDSVMATDSFQETKYSTEPDNRK
jgi:flagellar assembly protein FliH